MRRLCVLEAFPAADAVGCGSQDLAHIGVLFHGRVLGDGRFSLYREFFCFQDDLVHLNGESAVLIAEHPFSGFPVKVFAPEALAALGRLVFVAPRTAKDNAYLCSVREVQNENGVVYLGHHVLKTKKRDFACNAVVLFVVDDPHGSGFVVHRGNFAKADSFQFCAPYSISESSRSVV